MGGYSEKKKKINKNGIMFEIVGVRTKPKVTITSP